MLVWAPATLVWASTLAVAGVHPATVTSLSFPLLCAAALSWRGTPLPRGAWVLLGLASWSAVQCVPLPADVVAVLSPGAHQIWTDAQQLTGERGWIPLSIEPEATRFESVKFVVYAAVWILGQQVGRRRGLKHVASIVFGLGLAVALITWLHSALGMTRVYGIYLPQYAGHGVLGPVLNPNNLAGLFNLACFCGLGIALHRRTTHERALFTSLAVATLLAGSFLTGSRGGAASLALGLCLFGFFLMKRRAPDALSETGRRGALVLAAIGAGAGFISLAWNVTLLAQLRDASLSKLDLLAQSARVALEFPWFGTGRGGFSPAVAPHLAPGSEQVFTHAENWLVESITGWGALVGLAAVVALGWSLRPRPQLVSRSSTRVALYCGVLVLALQNLVDLGLELVGIAVPFLFVLGALNAERFQGDQSAAELGTSLLSSGSAQRFRAALGSLAPAKRWYLGVSATLILWQLTSLPRLAHSERHQLSAELRAHPEQPLHAKLVRALMRHPGDAFLMRLGAAVALAEGHGDALSWINGSLRRDPRQAATYLLLADLLYAAGYPDQALPALREAADASAGLHGEVAARVELWAPDQLERAIPSSPRGTALLLELARRTRHDALSTLALELAVERGEATAPQGLSRSWLDAVERGAAPCETGWLCLDAVEDVLSHLPATQRESDLQWLMIEARLLSARGRHEAAFSLLDGRCDGEPRCAALHLRAASELPFDKLRRAADRYVAAYCSNRRDCADAEAHIGRLYERRGERLVALKHLERAATQRDDSASWLHAARVASQSDRRHEAYRLWERARQAAEREDERARSAVREAKAMFSAVDARPLP